MVRKKANIEQTIIFHVIFSSLINTYKSLFKLIYTTEVSDCDCAYDGHGVLQVIWSHADIIKELA